MKANMLRWTSEKPTEPGWYWYRDIDDASYGTEMCHVENVNGELCGAFNDRDMPPVDNLNGQWCGPLPRPGGE